MNEFLTWSGRVWAADSETQPRHHPEGGFDPSPRVERRRRGASCAGARYCANAREIAPRLPAL